MKENILELNNEISHYLNSRKNKGSISFSARSLEGHAASDADIYLHILFENEPLAKMGISYGLEKYYQLDDFGGADFYFDQDPLVPCAIEKADKKWGVTLMQSFSGKKSLRNKLSKKGSDYKEMLMKEMTHLSKKFKFPIEFYLPGNLVFWNLNSINPDALFTCKGMYDVLYENYDYVAKKFGFQLSSDESLYER